MGKENGIKGFTLIELLAVIVILSVVALITVPIISESIDSSKSKAYEEQKNMIISAARNYTSQNPRALTDNTVLDISELKYQGFLDQKDIKNPVTNEGMNGCVYIKKEGKTYTYTYIETSKQCDAKKSEIASGA